MWHSTQHGLDGACEQDVKSGSLGGVIFSPCGVCLNFFGEAVPRRILDGLFSHSKNPIHELELLPVWLAIHLWGELFAYSQVVFYIDNESTRMAYIRGDGSTDLGAKIVEHFVSLEAKMQHRVWFGRVPSHSNPADSPSHSL